MTVFALVSIVVVGLLGGAFYKGRQENRPYAAVLVLMSILPAFIILGFAYFCVGSRRSSAPMPVVGMMYLFGVFSGLPAALAEAELLKVIMQSWLPTDGKSPPPPLWKSVLMTAVMAFCVVALIEESIKMGLAWLRAAQAADFCTEYGIVVMSLACSLGFASVENASYVLGTDQKLETAFTMAALRGAMAVPIHAAFGIMEGEGVARMVRARQRQEHEAGSWARLCGKCGVALGVFAVPWAIHGAYDTALMIPDYVYPQPTNEWMVASFVSAGLICVVAVGVAYWRLRVLLRRSGDEKPRCEPSRWPSLSAFDEATTCLG